MVERPIESFKITPNRDCTVFVLGERAEHLMEEKKDVLSCRHINHELLVQFKAAFPSWWQLQIELYW